MNIKYTKCVLAIATLAAAVSAAHAEPKVVSPFGAVAAKPAAIPVMSKLQAKAALSAAASARVAPKFLDTLLARESNEFIVMFDDETPPTLAKGANLNQRLADQRLVFKATRARVRSALAGNDVEFREELANMPTALVRTKSRAALVALLNQPGVAGVYPNATLTANMAQSLPVIHQGSATGSLHRGAGTTVAVIDSGTDYRVAAFGSCSAPGGSCRVSHAVSVADTPYSLVPTGHGTNVAAIVADVAPDTRIAAIDAFDPTVDAQGNPGEATSTFKVSKGIDWVLGNRVALNIVALNLSLGVADIRYAGACPGSPGTSEAYYAAAMTSLRNANIMPVVAAGNSASAHGISVPACSPGAISVGALYAANWIVPAQGITYGPADAPVCTDFQASVATNRVACLSNASTALTMWAPGALITAAGTRMAGTSQAAPHVAGTVALLRASDVAPNESLDQIQARLTSSTPTSAALTITDPRSGVTKPRLDVLSALAHEHYQVMQKVYIAYYGRPADPGGLAFWTVALSRGGAPSTITALELSYGSNATVKNVIDNFANAAESTALYGGKPTIEFVTAIYRNSFNREPDTAGRDWWAAQIDNGNLTRGKAALSIMAAAQSSDIEAVNRKAAVATNFTTAIDTAAEFNAFIKPGGTGPARARAMLAQVGSTTSVSGFQGTIDATLQQIVATNP